MADTREIAKSEWRVFFSSFSDQHDDEPVDIQVMGSEIGAQIEGRELHLRGISPARNAQDSDLALMLESIDGGHLTHMIANPVHVWLQRTQDNTDEALEIQSADGTKTLLRFGSSSLNAPAE